MAIPHHTFVSGISAAEKRRHPLPATLLVVSGPAGQKIPEMRACRWHLNRCTKYPPRSRSFRLVFSSLLKSKYWLYSVFCLALTAQCGCHALWDHPLCWDHSAQPGKRTQAEGHREAELLVASALSKVSAALLVAWNQNIDPQYTYACANTCGHRLVDCITWLLFCNVLTYYRPIVLHTLLPQLLTMGVFGVH